ncbi:demethylmenaquinone methyltransferase / 2-methoxy-6-polyprenyl-1,4-benzoquinol methylase [Halogranum amylolyticum]|uniref:Demethylmenaquinone methyltransferase / 2-methoxy-6-polyprenyl-1,4-benzoquinol methylase n=1 Tax=Halogranum amylolyticum TaxID=660520 RepID=A0A1H8S665_9EURY|nr:class I SAM-dependent methyltransferase [Halogranum amylolyticum]SEO73653.1 demethylmenaquinone methyltransferase / 2-methoxy-6-polyprenyl-1,4-benzoquinol methylase [Halogranum amylolyticum]
MHGVGDVRFFDRVARLYDLAMPPAERGALLDGLSRAERPVEHVLDVGGGSGRAGVTLTAPDRQVTVVDVSGEMLSRARGRGLDCVRGDARTLPVADGAVDAVTVVDAFHHMPDQRAVLANVARVLAPGGAVVIREFDPETLLGRVVERVEDAVGMGSLFTGPDDLARAIERTGLDARVLDRGFGYTVVGVKQDNN